MAKSDGKEKRLAGIDVGGTKIYALITDADGKILGSSRKKTRAERGFEGVMERVIKCLGHACTEADVGLDDLDAIGMGVPSPVLPDGTAVNAPNMGWRNVPLVKTMEKETGRPVYAENDCNVGTLGEYALGAGKGANTLVGLFVGTGLGGGIVYRGEMIRGENSQAAEIGHAVVRVDGRKCGCGHNGCLEAYASKTGIGRFIAYEVMINGRETVLTEECGGDFGSLRSSVLARAYTAKDPLTVEALHQLARYLGIGVGNLITMLGPDRVLIGGGVFEALGKELLPMVRDAAKESTHPPPSYNDTEIVLARLGDDAVALGAMVYARQCLEHD